MSSVYSSVNEKHTQTQYSNTCISFSVSRGSSCQLVSQPDRQTATLNRLEAKVLKRIHLIWMQFCASSVLFLHFYCFAFFFCFQFPFAHTFNCSTAATKNQLGPVNEWMNALKLHPQRSFIECTAHCAWHEPRKMKETWNTLTASTGSSCAYGRKQTSKKYLCV